MRFGGLGGWHSDDLWSCIFAMFTSWLCVLKFGCFHDLNHYSTLPWSILFGFRKKQKKIVSDVATSMNYGIAASFSRWSKYILNLKTGITRITWALTTTTSSQRWTPSTCTNEFSNTYLIQGQAHTRFPHGWLKIYGSQGYPHYVWVDHRWAGCTRNQVLGRSPIRVLF